MHIWTFSVLVCGLSVLGSGCSATSSDGGVLEGEDETNNEGWVYTDPETGETYPIDYNRTSTIVYVDEPRVAQDNGGEFGTVGQALSGTDQSGKIAMEYVTCSPPNLDSKKTTCGCSVSQNYVLVGGGASAFYTGAGAMLYETRPQDVDNNGDGLTWLAASKAHMVDDAHTLSCYAVGMRIRDTAGNYIARATLKSHVDYKRITAGSSDNPSGQCDSPAGKFVIGGGAKSNWTGAGQLLTESYPNSGSSWFGRSKAHMVSDVASIDVHCISISPSIPNFGSFTITRSSAQKFTDAYEKSVTVWRSDNPQMVPTCGAGQAFYGNEGRMLTSLTVSNVLTGTTSKDHMEQDAGWTRDWMIQARRTP